MLSVLPAARSKATSSSATTILQTRTVSSSPYGRTHVWKHRQRKLPNPVVPQFPQLVIRADGSSFTQWTTSPRSFMKLTRDTTNAPLWNVSALANEGMQEESETTGRLGRFSRRFDRRGRAKGHRFTCFILVLRRRRMQIPSGVTYHIACVAF
ncbi:unnamed protein product [Peniophora sp. CBMAI 1063]|nr:unnamed protein product [Peniophora sp. CBMAI 1063]